MATVVLSNPDPQKFPPGTTVKAYKRSNWHGLPGQPSGTPEGSQDASATVATDGTITFTGLADGTAYLLYAASPDRYASFSSPAASAGGGPATVADGADVAEGATTDASSASTVIGLLKNIKAALASTLTATLAAGTAAIGKVGHDTTGLGDGRKTVTAFGTAEAIAASTACKWVVVTALTSNTQQVNVGASTVLAASGTSRGVPLAAGESVTILIDNLNKVYVDSRVNGEGVAFLYGT